MLVLSRKLWERVYIGPDIVIQVVEVAPGRVRLGISAPRDLEILREELVPADERHPERPFAEGGAE